MLDTSSYPRGDSDKIIILANNEGLGFRLNAYREDLTDYITETKFKDIITKANKICEKAWREKKINEKRPQSEAIRWLLWTAIVISLFQFLMLISLVYRNGSTELFNVNIFMTITASCLTIIVAVKNQHTEPLFVNLEEKIISELIAYFHNVNNDPNYKQFLKWEIGQKYYYLVLRIKNQQFIHSVDSYDDPNEQLISNINSKNSNIKNKSSKNSKIMKNEGTVYDDDGREDDESPLRQ